MQTFDDRVPDEDRSFFDQLKIVVEPDPKGVRVRLLGEVDLATAPELDRVLGELAGNGHGRVLTQVWLQGCCDR